MTRCVDSRLKDTLDEVIRIEATRSGRPAKRQTATIPVGVARLCNDAGQPNSGDAARGRLHQCVLNDHKSGDKRMKMFSRGVAASMYLGAALVG